MNELVTYLESKKAIFHGAMVLMLLYVPHAGYLFMKLEHIDMTISGFTFLNWLYGIALAAIIEFLILVFLIHGYRNTGKFYAIVSFFLNAFYYDYWFQSLMQPGFENHKITVISLFVCLTHSIAVWQLSELFFKRLKDDKSEFWCDECNVPFPSKKSYEGHYAKVHKNKKEALI